MHKGQCECVTEAWEEPSAVRPSVTVGSGGLASKPNVRMKSGVQLRYSQEWESESPCTHVAFPWVLYDKASRARVCE